jgi:hypothetical protein
LDRDRQRIDQWQRRRDDFFHRCRQHGCASQWNDRRQRPDVLGDPERPVSAS